jgi:hypothetical protein
MNGNLGHTKAHSLNTLKSPQLHGISLLFENLWGFYVSLTSEPAFLNIVDMFYAHF